MPDVMNTCDAEDRMIVKSPQEKAENYYSEEMMAGILRERDRLTLTNFQRCFPAARHKSQEKKKKKKPRPAFLDSFWFSLTPHTRHLCTFCVSMAHRRRVVVVGRGVSLSIMVGVFRPPSSPPPPHNSSFFVSYYSESGKQR